MEEKLFDKLALLDRRHWMVYGKELFLKPYLSGKEDRKILDAGCGTGTMLEFLSEYGTVTGLDSSSYALRLAARLGKEKGVELKEGDVSAMPFPDGTFDVVTLLDVLYHRAVKDDDIVVKECARVLKKGGILIVIDSAFKFLKTTYDDEAHVARRYELKKMKEKLEHEGFLIKKASHIFFFIFPAVAVVRFINNSLKIRIKESDHMFKAGPFTNFIFRALMSLEAALLRVLDLPWGTSIFIVGTKR